MKKNAIIYLNDNEAQVTKAFEKNARIFNSPEFKLWREYKAMFPAAEMVTKTIKRNPNKTTYKNLTYANMERFIKVQPNSKTALDEFNTTKEKASIEPNPYRIVLAWFLKKYDYDKYKAFFESDKSKKKAQPKEDKAEDTNENKDTENATAENGETPAIEEDPAA